MNTLRPPHSSFTRRGALVAGAALMAAPAILRAQAPGLVISGGVIHTGTAAGAVQAIAMQGDRIVHVGALDDALRAAPGARRLDLKAPPPSRASSIAMSTSRASASAR